MAEDLSMYFKEKWDELQGAVKRQWDEITYDELDQINGDRNTLIDMVQEKYDLTRNGAQTEVDEFLSERKLHDPAESGLWRTA